MQLLQLYIKTLFIENEYEKGYFSWNPETPPGILTRWSNVNARQS